MTDIAIRNETDAIALIEQHVRGALPEDARVVFDGWPSLVIKLEGEKFDQSLTPSVMKGFIELQKAINRSYAAARYDDPQRRLTDEEKDALEITVKVEQGSSLVEINLQEPILRILQDLVVRMDPNSALIAAVVTATLFVGKSIIGKYLENQRQDKADRARNERDRVVLENMQIMSAEETRRAQVIAGLVEQNHQLINVSRIAHDARTELVKSMSSADQVDIGGIVIDGDMASTLTRNAREMSSEIRIDGTYKILRVDASDPDVFKVKVANMESGREIEAAVQDDSVNSDNKRALQQAEWARRPVRLEINAKLLRDRIHKAVILRVSSVQQDPPSTSE